MAAVLTEPAGMIRLSVPIEKREDTAEINPVDGTPDLMIWGKVTDGTLDSDLQIVDPDASLKWIRKWFDSKGNVRGQHDAGWPAGKGIEVDGFYVKSLICDPKAKHFIRNGILNDYSIGIINPDVRSNRDPRFAHLPDVNRATKGIITDRSDGLSGLGEISVVDRGANYGSSFSLVKAAADGTPEWAGTWTSEPAEPRAPKGVTLTLPKDVSVTMKPSDLAKLATFRQKLVQDQAAVKAAAQPVVLTKTAAPDAVKRDMDPDVGGGVDRDKIPAEDFAGAHRSFPIVTPGDVSDAASSLGRARGQSRSKIRRRIIAIAHRKGDAFTAQLPEAWKKGKKASKSAAAVPDLTKCMTCQGTGMAEGKPCPDCEDGKKTAKAVAALKAARRAALDTTSAPVGDLSRIVVVAEKKHKVMCGHCGAKQNIKHAHCPECGNPLHPGAIPLPGHMGKNHDFSCLGCGRELDKGEKFCPGCGRENPGYLEVADHKIPMNADKAAKERVSTQPDVSKGKKKKAGKKGKPFGGKQAPPFGEKEPASAAEKRKGKGKGRSPAAGVKGHETMGLPAHREPDGPPVEMFERDTRLEDGDEHAEMAAAMRHKSVISAYGITPADAVLHDLTCPAFSPAMTAKYLPGASLASIDTQAWQSRALEAASAANIGDAVAKYNEAAALSRAAVTLKTAQPDAMYRIAQASHEAFLAANKTFHDATPGPGSAPTPGHVQPGAFRRPYIHAGHAAESPQATGPRTFPVGEHHPEAEDFTRGYLHAGHAAESPDNSHGAEPVHETTTGQASRAHDVRAMDARDYESARSAMHDHLSRIAPGMCPMSPEPGHGTQKPAPPVPAAVGAPEPHAAKASRADRRAARAQKAAKAAAEKARKAKAAAREQRRFDKAVAAAVAKAQEPAGLVALPLDSPQPVLDADAITAAVRAATAPLQKQIRAQGKTIRKQGKVVTAMAGQPDTTGAPFRGAGGPVNKQASATVAPPRTPAEAAALAQSGYMRSLAETMRESWDPRDREAARAELRKQLGVDPMTGNDEPNTHPFRT